MEEWQKAHIKKHLTKLVENTTCSTTFLTILFSFNIINSEEVSSLQLPIKTPSRSAQELYTTVQTRRGGYEALKKALNDTNQTGAYDILCAANPNNLEADLKTLEEAPADKSISDKPETEATVLPPTSKNDSSKFTYDKNNLLGKGCDSTEVYKGRFGDLDVAVKLININYVEGSKIMKEVDFLKNLERHENVVRYYGYKMTEFHAVIALELCESNLHDLVKIGGVPKIGAVKILRQATKGVAFLHCNKIIHRDLKPANILIDKLNGEKSCVKISDFGMSRRIPEGGSRLSCHSTGVGTEGYIAPEVLNQLYDDHEKKSGIIMGLPADIFSLGCVFYFVLSEGKHPFGHPLKQMANIVEGKSTLVKEELKPTEIDKPVLIELVKKMISTDEKERPIASAVLSRLSFFGSKSSVGEKSDKTEVQGSSQLKTAKIPKTELVLSGQNVIVGSGDYSVANIIRKWKGSELFYQLEEKLSEMGNYLAVPVLVIKDIKQDRRLNKMSSFEAVQELLSHWVAASGKAAKLEILVNALDKNGLRYFADLLLDRKS